MYGQLAWRKCIPSAGLEQQNGHLTQVEVNEMLGLMSHVAAKVPPDDAVPGWVIFLVKLLCGTKTHCVHQTFVDQHGRCEDKKQKYKLCNEAHSMVDVQE